MSKRKILIASVLKPVDEPRMYKKLGLSFAEMSNSEVHILGFKNSSDISDSRIKFHPIFNFNRLSINRFLAPIRFLYACIKINPDLIIVNTIELILPAVILKVFKKIKLLYDVRENHWKNIEHLGVYPFLIRFILKLIIRFTEFLSFKFIDHFILAEKCYEQELTFKQQNFVVIQNKYEGPVIERKYKDESKVVFVFSGTIHKSTGINHAIEFVSELIKLGLNCELIICGYVTSKNLKKELDKLDYPWLIKDYDSKAISRDRILKAYEKADIVLAPYIVSPQNENKIPSKFFDAFAIGIPIIISPNYFWINEFSNQDNVYFFKDQPNDNLKLVNDIINSNLKYSGQIWANWDSEKAQVKTLIKFLD